MKPTLTGTAGSGVKEGSERESTQAICSEESKKTDVAQGDGGEKSTSEEQSEENNLVIETDEHKDEGTVNDGDNAESKCDDGGAGSNDDNGAKNDGIGSDVLSEKQKTPIPQGTAEASVSDKPSEDTEASIKRKNADEDDPEKDVSPPKKRYALDSKTESLMEQRKEERDARSLFLKNLPRKTTAEMVKKLSPEIINVRIPLERGRYGIHTLYAFIEFESEEAAERNFTKIMEKRINNKKFKVDYCGEKSKFKKASKAEHAINSRRLFIPNMPAEVSVHDLKKHMPDAIMFTPKWRGTKRFMYITFDDEEKAKKAFEANGKLTLHGKKVTVLFAYKKIKKSQGGAKSSN